MPQLALEELDRLHRAQALVAAGEPDRAEFELAGLVRPVARRRPGPRRGPRDALVVAAGPPRGTAAGPRGPGRAPAPRHLRHERRRRRSSRSNLLLSKPGDERQARQLAAWLNHLHGHLPAVSRFVQLLDLPGLRGLPQVVDRHVTRLADELTSCPDLVPSLVFAQKLAPNTRTLSALRGAVKAAGLHL